MPKPVSSEELVLKMQALPGTLRDFLASPDVVESIEEIQKTYALTNQTTIALSRAIAWYVAGFLNASELGSELAKIAPQGKFAELRNDVIKKIFTPFASQLHAHGLNFESIAISETPTLAAPKPAVATAPKPEEKPSPQPPKAEIPQPIIIGQAPSPAPAPQPITPPATAPSPAPAVPPAPTAAVPTAPKPAPPPPAAAPRITVSPQQPGVPPTAPQEVSKAPQPEASPKAVRYTPPPVIPEIPKVIPPVGRPAPAKPSEPVIDLSTFQISVGESRQPQNPGEISPDKTPPKTQSQPASSSGQSGIQPKTKGNVIDLKP
jgi:hypothetical protein